MRYWVFGIWINDASIVDNRVPEYQYCINLFNEYRIPNTEFTNNVSLVFPL